MFSRGPTPATFSPSQPDRTQQGGIAAVALASVVALGAALVFVLAFTPEVGAQASATVTITLDAGGNTNTPFPFVNGQTGDQFTLNGGQSASFVVPSGQSIEFELSPGGVPAGFVYERIRCTGDGGQLSTLLQTISGTLAPGDNVSCTVEVRQQGTASITIVMQAPGNPSQIFTLFDDQTRQTFTLTDGESETFEVTADESFLYFQLLTPSTWQIEDPFCTGDGGTIEERPNGAIQGTLSEGSSAVCTFVNSRPATTEINVMSDAGNDLITQFSGKFTFGPADSSNFNLRGGQIRSFDHFTSDAVELEMFNRSEWRVHAVSCTGDNGALTWQQTENGVVVTGTLEPDTTEVKCTFGQSRIVPVPNNIFPVVTCLGGNGRIDVNIVNTDEEAAVYRLIVGALTPRDYSVEPDDWWRSPVTGRPDGQLGVQVQRDGAVIMNDFVTVACETGEEEVSRPEVQMFNICRGGLGFVVWQFSNPTDESRVYGISFSGVDYRSTFAPAFGATVRGVSGRPDGTYDYEIYGNSELLTEDSVTVDCS